ncbi:MAG TPA: hypothetical protein VNM45_04835 [Bacillus sp. (in: firmicutes)]|nr:hypothetical protein [Bacillus sp. (in: firmicutes)]
MKIKEILELTQSKKLAEIAKEHLEFGEKKAKEALKQAGCTFTNGKRGWFLAEGTNESVLDRSIYEFAPPNRRGHNLAKKEISATLEAEAVKNPSSQLSNNTESKQENKPINKQVGKTTNQPSRNPGLKKVTYEIEEQLHDKLKIRAIVEKRTVSEIVNESLRKHWVKALADQQKGGGRFNKARNHFT